ncbi:MAG: Acylphosphatase [Methanosaeta sp. PtaU1.Bin112]|nr:MAG: Acylphosphatase [Methanosaeta sp. PtaU1.Bin112]
MQGLTAYVSGRVQRVGYRAKVVSLANGLGLTGLVQNRPDGRVLVIAEGENETVEQFASAIRIENSLINVEKVDTSYSHASGEFSVFKKVTGPDEVGERLDDGIEILKCMMVGINTIIKITQSGFERLGNKMDVLNSKMDSMNSKMDGLNCKTDKMLDKQDETIGDIEGLRSDLKEHMDERFDRIEDELADIKSAGKERGTT